MDKDFNERIRRCMLEDRRSFYRDLWDFLGEQLGEVQFPIVYKGIQKLIRKYDFK